MAASTETVRQETAEPRPRSRPATHGRPLLSRLSAGHVVMLLAGLLAAVANFAVLRGQSDTVDVLVAARDLAPGEHLMAADLRPVAVEADGAPVTALLSPADLDGLGEAVLTAGIAAGEPLRSGDLRPVAAGDGLRRMSVPLPAERAAGGAVAVGDRVDVIATRDGRAAYVVAGAPVLGVSERSPGAIGGGVGGFALTLAVDGDAALCLARAIQDGALDVVVSTGQDPVDVVPCRADAAASGPEPAGSDPAGSDPTGPQPARAGEPAGRGTGALR